MCLKCKFDSDMPIICIHCIDMTPRILNWCSTSCQSSWKTINSCLLRTSVWRWKHFCPGTYYKEQPWKLLFRKNCVKIVLALYFWMFKERHVKKSKPELKVWKSSNFLVPNSFFSSTSIQLQLNKYNSFLFSSKSGKRLVTKFQTRRHFVLMTTRNHPSTQ